MYERLNTHAHILWHLKRVYRRRGNKDTDRKRDTRAHTQCAMCREVIPDLKWTELENGAIFIRDFFMADKRLCTSTTVYYVMERKALLPPSSCESALITSDWRVTSTYKCFTYTFNEWQNSSHADVEPGTTLLPAWRRYYSTKIYIYRITNKHTIVWCCQNTYPFLYLHGALCDVASGWRQALDWSSKVHMNDHISSRIP